MEKLILPLALRSPYKCLKCANRFYNFSASRRNLRRAFLSVLFVLFIVFLLIAVWRVIAWFGEEPPPGAGAAAVLSPTANAQLRVTHTR